MRRYEFECAHCETRFDTERPVEQAGEPAPCPFCGRPAARVFSSPKFLFKPDPSDNRPIWHNHGAFGHAHAPGRGFHGKDTKDPHR